MKLFNIAVFLGVCLASLTAIASDGYEAVDPTTLNQIDGKSLMIGAYAVVLTSLISYSIFLWVWTIRINKALKAEKKLK